MRKAMVGLLAAITGCSLMVSAAVASEAASPASSDTPAAAAPAAADAPAAESADAPKVITTDDGVLSIEIPDDGDTWDVVKDSDSWFAISDGKNSIVADHVINGPVLPEISVAKDTVAEVYQVIYSTKDEVFVITGSIADADDADAVKAAVSSFKVLEYGKLNAPQDLGNGYALVPLNETRYCIDREGVNIRASYSRDSEAIDGFRYGDKVTVTGIVTKDGQESGWMQINHNGRTAYVWAEYFGANNPNQQQAQQPAQQQPAQPAQQQPAQQPAQPAQQQPAQQQPAQPAQQPAQPEQQPPAEPAAPQRTGYSMDLYAPEGGGLIQTVYELSDGTWVDDNGVGYTQQAGGGYEFYGTDGSTWVTEAYFEENPVGQIFTGNETKVFFFDDKDHGYTIYELTQGGWIDDYDVAFTQRDGDKTVFDAEDGRIMVTEEFFKTHADGDAPTGVKMALFDVDDHSTFVGVKMTEKGWTDADGGVYKRSADNKTLFDGPDGSVWTNEP